MRDNTKSGLGSKRKTASLLAKLMMPMMLFALLQSGILGIFLTVNDGFTFAKNNSYNILSEKTGNRKGYVENLFIQKTSLVYETAKEVDKIAEHLFSEHGVDVSAVAKDKNLDNELLGRCTENLISLIRRDMVNDAFIILNTGTLYDDGTSCRRPGIYLRDTDVSENSISDNKDIFMELGSSETAHKFGLPLDFEWALYLDVTDMDSGDFDFFFRTVEAGRENPDTPLYNLGYWSKATRISASQQGSIRYTLPLIAENGTVYGVIGIGLLEKTVEQSIPSSDFNDSSMCYAIGVDENGDGIYEPILSRGAAYGRLVTEDTVLSTADEEGSGLYRFDNKKGPALIGSVELMNLYHSGSPYRSQRWALISIADRAVVLENYYALIQIVLISLLISVLISGIAAMVIGRRISTPVERLVKRIEKSRDSHAPVVFNSSGILEIDTLAQAVVELQADVAEYAAQMSGKEKDEEYMERLMRANEALRTAYAAAEQANSAKTDFLSRMSHDIRTPMNAIIGMTTIAEQSLDDKEKLHDCFRKISSSSRYLLSLINEVLDMSKIESKKFVLAKEQFNLLSLAESLVEMVLPMAKEKNHELEVHIDGVAHANVVGDSLRIQQVFMNLMSNAIKYTAPGGHICFSLTEHSAREKTGCYVLVFSDNGKGMKPEFMEKLFKPFEREEDERVNKEQGTGLGMAITYNIVKLMGGDISVKSVPDEGTTFTVTVYLPFVEEDLSDEPRNVHLAEPAETQNAIERMKETDFSGRRVLLVDDNELNLEIAEEILMMMKLTVETATNGREALDKFAASEAGYYDMIFMDVQMPIMNGYEAAHAIRSLAHPNAASIPIVAMTANAFAEDVRDAQNAGMNEHIPKPLDLDKLLLTLTRWL